MNASCASRRGVRLQPAHRGSHRVGEVGAGIRRYNAAHGVPEPPTRGYFETMTRFYIWAVAELVATTRPRPVHELANALAERLGDTRLPLRYYSEVHLMSWDARAWVEPDSRRSARRPT